MSGSTDHAISAGIDDKGNYVLHFGCGVWRTMQGLSLGKRNGGISKVVVNFIMDGIGGLARENWLDPKLLPTIGLEWVYAENADINNAPQPLGVTLCLDAGPFERVALLVDDEAGDMLVMLHDGLVMMVAELARGDKEAAGAWRMPKLAAHVNDR